jgi:hypothetical protein
VSARTEESALQKITPQYNADLRAEGASLFGRRSAKQLTRGKAAEALNFFMNRAQKFLQDGFKFVA